MFHLIFLSLRQGYGVFVDKPIGVQFNQDMAISLCGVDVSTITVLNTFQGIHREQCL